ncbi:unnamed protein product [Larinioides sclopetarius]|uniref:Neurotransmitter-gated ion-channel ligand-binding domain-containing protein n=1 Tax=Larinioides sclopetarius TaxID=280406 RepID=A0AAV2B799_9ARAC
MHIFRHFCTVDLNGCWFSDFHSLNCGDVVRTARPKFDFRTMRSYLLVIFGALHFDRVLFAKSLSFDEIIPVDYDNHSPPKINKGDISLPVNVSVHLWVIQIRSVDEVDMDFKMDVVVRQMWEDHRLIFPEDRSGGRNKIILDASWGNALWTPDVWFKNALDTKLHQWVLPNVFYWLMRNRTVYFSGRVTLQLSCDMNMEKFPHDSQNCGVSIIALMSPTTEMQLQWFQAQPIRISRLLNLPQFEVGNLSLSRCDTSVYGG